MVYSEACLIPQALCNADQNAERIIYLFMAILKVGPGPTKCIVD